MRSPQLQLCEDQEVAQGSRFSESNTRGRKTCEILRSVTYSLCCSKNVLEIKKKKKSVVLEAVQGAIEQNLSWNSFGSLSLKEWKGAFLISKVEQRRDFANWAQPTKNSTAVTVGSENYTLFFWLYLCFFSAFKFLITNLNYIYIIYFEDFFSSYIVF